MRRLLVSAAAVCGVLGLGATTASAQGSVYPPPSLTIVIDDDTLTPQTPFDVTLRGCDAEDAIVFEFGEAVAVVDCVAGSATASFVTPVEVGEFSGLVSFSEPRSPIGPFSVDVDVADVDAADADVAIDTDRLLGLRFRVVENDGFDPTVLILMGLAVAAGGFTIARLPQT